MKNLLNVILLIILCGNGSANAGNLLLSGSETSSTCSITGGNFCQGSSTQLCSVTSNAYLWSTGATTQCITVGIGGTYTVTVTDGASATSSCTKTVVAYPTPACIMPGSVIVCGGSGIALCGPTGFAGYLWSTGATTQCIFTYQYGFYTITVTDINGCTNSCITALLHADPFCNITGSNFCYGSSTQLCSNPSYSYLWSTGATTQCITVSTSGTYTVTTTDANGCTCSWSKTVTAYPPPNCTISGNFSYCQGSSTQICGTTGSASYLWNTGATTQCVTVLAGNYTVTVTDLNGCTNSCSATVTVSTKPAANITPAGSTSFCTGGSVLLSANTGAGLTYQWKKGGNNISGATDSLYTATVGGNYRVIVTNSNGCSKTSAPVTVTGPPVTTVTVTGSLVICPPDSAVLSVPYKAGLLYQWMKNNINLNGDTFNVFAAKTAGTYKVRVTNSYGCTKTSGTKQVSISCGPRTGNGISINNDLSISPNPTTGSTKLVFSLDEEQVIEVNVLNMLGEQVEVLYSGNQPAGEVELEFDVSRLSEGIYFVELVRMDGGVRRKLSVVK